MICEQINLYKLSSEPNKAVTHSLDCVVVIIAYQIMYDFVDICQSVLIHQYHLLHLSHKKDCIEEGDENWDSRGVEAAKRRLKIWTPPGYHETRIYSLFVLL